jgi:hypothetical protein
MISTYDLLTCVTLPRLGFKPNLSKVGHVINLSTYFIELDRRIFSQLTIINHTQHHL